MPLIGVTTVGVRDTVRIIRQAAGTTLARDLELAESQTALSLSAAQGHVDFFGSVLFAGTFLTSRPDPTRLLAVAPEVARHIAIEPTLWRVHVFRADGEALVSVDRSGVLASSEADGGSAPYYAWRAESIGAGQQPILPVEVRHSSTGTETTIAAGLGGQSEELRGPVYMGRMLGTFTHREKGEPVFHELMAVMQAGGQLVVRLKHFNPDLTGWEEKDKYVEFPFVARKDGAMYFRGLT